MNLAILRGGVERSLAFGTLGAKSVLHFWVWRSLDNRSAMSASSGLGELPSILSKLSAENRPFVRTGRRMSCHVRLEVANCGSVIEVGANGKWRHNKEKVMRISPAIALIGMFVAGPVAAVPADKARIVALQQKQAEAWNAHDINAYASLFTPDADVINVLGWHWQSRGELQEKLGRGFQYIFANSELTITDVSVEFLKPDIAVAHVRWTLTGALSPTGSGSDVPQQGIQTQMLVRRAGGWSISHFQNTNSVPERPFPLPSDFRFVPAPER